MAPMGEEPIQHIVVGPDDELAVAQAIAGPIINLEPVCPLCGHRGATRVEVNRRTDERVYLPIYLTWSASSGVTASIRRGVEMPRGEMVDAPDGVGMVNVWKIGRVRCDRCEYVAAASAFCTPTGPPVDPGATID